MHTSSRLAAVLVLGASGAMPAMGQTIDAILGPRDRFDGRIAFPDDEDSVSYPAVAGTELSLVVTAQGAGSVQPRVELTLDGEPLVPQHTIVSAGGKQQRRLRYAIPHDGEARVRVRSDKGLGDYRLKIRERLPTKSTAKQALSSGESMSLAFPARAGAVGHVIVERLAGDPAPLSIPELVLPSGSPLALDGLVVPTESSDVNELVVGPVPLTEDGRYEVAVESNQIGGEVLRVRVVVTLPDDAADTFEEEVGAAHAEGSIFLEGGDWLESDTADALSGDFVAGELLFVARGSADPSRIAHELGGELVATTASGFSRVRMRGVPLGRLAAEAADREQLAIWRREFRKRSDVRIAEPNYIRRSFSVPTDPLYPQQWDLVVSGTEHATDLVPGDGTRIIAVLDTGIRFEHPDLNPRLVAGYDFVSDSWNSGDGNGLDPDPTDVVPQQGTHGTHVTGTLVGVCDNGVGIAGATRFGKVMPIRVLGILGGTDFDIAQALMYAARLPNASGTLPPKRAEVVNFSLGGPTPSAYLAEAVKQATEVGVVVVAAAGNSNSKTKMYPAALEGVIAVAATDRVDNKAFYSSYGPHVDIAAPGGDPYADLDHDGYPDDILSTVYVANIGPTFGRKAGTSMACPHVAAAAFLLRSADPELTPLEVEACLAAGALDLGAAGHDKYFGYGRLDIGRSLDALLGVDVGEKRLFSVPQQIAFEADDEVATITFANQGQGPAIEVESVATSAFYLSVDSVAATVPFSLEVHVDRAALMPGTYHATLDLQTSIGPRSVPIEVEVPAGSGPSLVHEAYVFAIDVASKAIVSQTAVDADDASHFEIGPLPEGTYRIVAATDLDLDGIAGEGHDFAGVGRSLVDGSEVFSIADGETVQDVWLQLAVGSAQDLPKGGKYPLLP